MDSLEDLTHDQLDQLADDHEVDEYPRSGVKGEKVAALEVAGITVDEAAHAFDVLATEAQRPTERVRLEPGQLSPTLAARADEERAAADALAERRAADRKRAGEHATVSERLRAAADRTAEREAEGATQVARIVARLADRDEPRTPDNVEE